MRTRPRLAATAAAILLALATAAACTPATPPTLTPERPESPAQTPAAAAPSEAVPPTSAEGLPDAALPSAVLNVRDLLSEQLGAPPEQIAVLEATAVDWPDGCLGAAGPDEMCIQVITPGYRIIFDVSGDRYVVHSNEQGDIYRVVEGPDGQGARTTID